MSALAKAKEQLAAVRKSAIAQRAKSEAKQKADIFVGAAAGAVIGHLERGGKRIPRIIDAVPIPGKGQWAIALAYGSDRASGEIKTRMRQAAIALAVLAGYESGKEGKVVAGK
jgi:hypothetical protein